MRLAKPINTFIPREEKILDFRGYNKKSVIADGEMREMYNLSSDEYPCLSQRKPRGVYAGNYVNPTTMIVKDKKLAVVSEGKFYYDGVQYPGLSLSDNTQMVAINTKICFFPEKMFFNVKTHDIGNLSAKTEGTNVSLAVTTSTITVTSGALSFEGLNVGDAVKVTASVDNAELLNISAVIQSIDNASITFPDETFISVIAAGETELAVTSDSVIIERSCPDLDFVMESNNRLWGVSNEDNTIYACKLGDPTNWAYFQNTSVDSYYAEQGTDGEWTGCAAYSKHLLFFKEDYIHRVFGSKPSEYQIESAQCHALEKGSSKSIAIINETVLYKSRLGIMAYSGGVPILISDNFGTDKYTDVVAGTDGIKYYASALRDGSPELIVYDMERFLWHKEDDVRASDFVYHGGKLLYIDARDGVIYAMSADNSLPSEADIEWMAQLGPFDEYIEDRKVYSKIKMRLELEEGAELAISISVDGGDWEWVQHINSGHDRTVFVPIVPRRCERFSIKLQGTGRCKVKSIVREYRQGTHRRDI